ncbi:DUF1028 domain-containing protein [Streptomyces sp. NRRL S-813]|uniref:DUF1028 domain-containing protein n=1 Tax=Streptomyces sp. NRRL S-813 TaxID=1463919 RepID=UPI0004C29F2D|nr:DUF1028 domain-containing protein [Streptomyces sp. NRRL S-813]
MTFSIVARSGEAFGVAVASKFLAVGAVVPAADAGAGAVATQAAANPRYLPQGLALLRTGVQPADVVAGLVATDRDCAHRQLGIVGSQGLGATYTGEECLDWAGGTAGDGYAIQGNILTGPEVIEAMESAWLSLPDIALDRRLLAALEAGDAAGGDRRGRQSAALYAVAPGAGYGGGSDVACDLRVDDHADPVAELRRLLDVHELLFGKPDPDALLELSGDLKEEVENLVTARGHASLEVWAGVENLENRLVPGKIDPVVLACLRNGHAHDEA